jgi:hypothetical protein
LLVVDDLLDPSDWERVLLEAQSEYDQLLGVRVLCHLILLVVEGGGPAGPPPVVERLSAARELEPGDQFIERFSVAGELLRRSGDLLGRRGGLLSGSGDLLS